MQTLLTMTSTKLANYLAVHVTEFSPFISFEVEKTPAGKYLTLVLTATHPFPMEGRAKKPVRFSLALELENLERWRVGFYTPGHSTNVDKLTQHALRKSVRDHISPVLATLPVDFYSHARSFLRLMAVELVWALEVDRDLYNYLAQYSPVGVPVQSIDFTAEMSTATSKSILIGITRRGKRGGFPVIQRFSLVIRPFVVEEENIATNWMSPPGEKPTAPPEELRAILSRIIRTKTKALRQHHLVLVYGVSENENEAPSKSYGD